ATTTAQPARSTASCAPRTAAMGASRYRIGSTRGRRPATTLASAPCSGSSGGWARGRSGACIRDMARAFITRARFRCVTRPTSSKRTSTGVSPEHARCISSTDPRSPICPRRDSRSRSWRTPTASLTWWRVAVPDPSRRDGRTIAITGASGVVGRHLCMHFLRAGWRVRALVRNASAPAFDSRVETFAIDLPETIDTRAFDGADAVVHAAYATRGGAAEAVRRTNELGTARVIDAARAARVRRFIFVSTLAARADADSYYGRSKKRLEDQLDAARDLAIRPGLVLAADGGLAQRLWSTMRTLHVAPLIAGGRQIVQTVHIDDLCAAFQR